MRDELLKLADMIEALAPQAKRWTHAQTIDEMNKVVANWKADNNRAFAERARAEGAA